MPLLGGSHPEAIACSQYQVSCLQQRRSKPDLHPQHAFNNCDVLSGSFFNPSSRSDQPPPYSLLKVVRGRLVCRGEMSHLYQSKVLLRKELPSSTSVIPLML